MKCPVGATPRFARRSWPTSCTSFFFADFSDFFKCWNAILTEIASGSEMEQEKWEPRLGWVMRLWSGWAGHYLGNEWRKCGRDWCQNRGYWGRWERWWRRFGDWRLGSKVGGAGLGQQGSVSTPLHIEWEVDVVHDRPREHGSENELNRCANRGWKSGAKFRIW